jgi:hypothetical protein
MELVPIITNSPSASNSPNAILSEVDDKIARYKDLLAKVIPFTKSDNVLEKKAAYDLNILLKCGINTTNNTVIMYLSDAIDHLIQHFIPDLNNLINNQVNLDDYQNQGYALLHDLVVVIMKTVMHKNKVEEFRQFCLQI